MNIEATSIYSAWGYAGTAVLAAVLIAVTAVVAHVLVKIVRKILKAATDGDIGGSIIANILRVAIWALGVSAVLSQCLGMNPSVIWGALGIGGVAISLGMQSTISNLIGGLQLSLSRDVGVGDWVTIGSGAPSEVLDINWRVTKLRDEFGNMSIVPNQVLNSTAVIVHPPAYAVSFDIMLANDADLDALRPQILALADEAIGQSGMRFEDTRAVLSVAGTTVDGISTRLKVYAQRGYNQIQINNAVMPPVLAYLEQEKALAHCYSG